MNHSVAELSRQDHSHQRRFLSLLRVVQRGQGLALVRGVPFAGELLSGVHQPTLPVTAST